MAANAYHAGKDQAQTQTWNERDVIQYALSTGFGYDDMELRELPFYFEGRGLLVSPTFATTLVAPQVPSDIGAKAELRRLDSFALDVFTPLLPKDSVSVETTTEHLLATEEAQEIVVTTISEVRRQADARAVCALRLATRYASVAAASELPKRQAEVRRSMPGRPADFVEVLEIAPYQLPLFRLCGDDRAHSVDNDAARRAGYPAPVIPSLCLAGHVCRIMLATVCDYDPTLVRRISAQSIAHATPRDELALHLWQDGPVLTYAVVPRPAGAAVLVGEITLAG